MNSVTNSDDIRCALPAIEAAHRRWMPVAMGTLLLFISAWTAASAAMFYSRMVWNRDGHVAEAVHNELGRVVFTDSDGRKRELYTPARKARPLKPGDRVSIRWLDGSDRAEFADESAGQTVLSRIFLGIAALMLCYPIYLFRTMRSDDARRARLKALDRRVPAQDWRVAEERVGSKTNRIEYRVFARFNEQGRWYEAASDRFSRDPSAAIDGANLRVLLDPTNPRLSLIAPDSLPPRRG